MKQMPDYCEYSPDECIIGNCPACNGKYYVIKEDTFNNELLTRTWKCKCGATGKEYHEISPVFSGIEVD